MLDAKALPHPVQYRWPMSTDQQAWTDLPETFKTKTTVDGLTLCAWIAALACNALHELSVSLPRLLRKSETIR